MTRHLSENDQSIDGQWRTCLTCRDWLHISAFPVHTTRGRIGRHCTACRNAAARLKLSNDDARARSRESCRRWYHTYRDCILAQRRNRRANLHAVS